MYEAILLQQEIDNIKSISSLINDGIFSKVYKGKCNLDKDIVIKIIKSNYCDSLFSPYNEGLRQLDNDNICRVLSAGRLKDNRIYYTFEFLSGGSLQNYINNNENIDNSTLINISIDILNGLSFLEKRNIIHGDIKPGNFIFDSNGKIKITDFGLSKYVGKNEKSLDVFYNKHISPEACISKLNGREPEKKLQDDIYALGILLYRIIDNSKTLESKIKLDNNTLVKISEGKLPNREKIPPHINKGIVRIIKKALNVKLDKRYKSFEDIKCDFTRVKSYIDWVMLQNNTYLGYHRIKRIFYKISFNKIFIKDKGRNILTVNCYKGTNKEKLRRDNKKTFQILYDLSNFNKIRKILESLE